MLRISLKGVLAAVLLLGVTSANAVLIDFITMADANEAGHNPLVISFSSVTLSITGHASDDDDNAQFAYLDSGNAGLGACKDVTGSAQCAPSNDDNVTTNEWLEFVFSEDVIIDNLWANNNHDGGFSSGDLITIAGTDYAAVKGDHSSGSDLRTDLAGNFATGPGGWLVSANTVFEVAYNNTQFYVAALEVQTVPEPNMLLLFALGLGLIVVVKSSKPAVIA